MFCTKCGKELADDAIVCTGCGCLADSTPQAQPIANDPHVTQLSEKVKTNAIIWIVIGALQIVTGVFFIVGILNILSAVNDLKYAKEVLENPTGIVARFEPLTMPIIVLIYNLIFGGLIGVAGSIYYFLGIRNFVMENRQVFEKFDN